MIYSQEVENMCKVTKGANMSTFYLLANTSYSQMLGSIIKTENKTIVIDGGTVNDSAQLINFLKESSVSHVDAWFFTHPHHDHMGCFVDIRKKAPEITVEKLYFNFPDLSDEKIIAFERSPFEAALWEDAKKWDTLYDTHKVAAGEVFEFDEVKIRVLRTYAPEITANLINNSSAVYRIDGQKSSVLILGDLGVEGGEDTLKKCSVELLQTDYTQMAHHGQRGVSREFYEKIKPKRCIWAAPDWLWDNDRGDGFDTSKFLTVRTREWMEALGVTEHLVEKDGIQKFEI